MKTEIQNAKPKIVIVGAGPAGTSLAIRLAKKNYAVFLIERERFPRHKLCGEFISPECLRHFSELGVLDEMLSPGGDRIKQTVFYEPNGKSVSISSKWFGGDFENALSLSRSEMDFRLLEKARELGVEVLEETIVTGVLQENAKVRGVKIKCKNGEMRDIFADLFVDATGRAGVLTKLTVRENNAKSVQVQNPKSKIQNRLVGFKTHLKNVNLEKGVCEIYFFRGGYGGLSYVEDNRANHCFLIRADVVKEFVGNADKIVEQVIFQNKRARDAMENAELIFDWLAVSVDGFGRKQLNPAANLFTIGDAAAFIDPFTGSGMLMAFESAEILAKTVTKNALSPPKIAAEYKSLHQARFQKRLRVCAILRRAAFVPNLARFFISALSLSSKAQARLARSTRQSFPATKNK